MAGSTIYICCIVTLNKQINEYSRTHSCGRRKIAEPRKYYVFLSLLSIFLLILFIIGVCTITTDHNNWYQSQVLEASSSMAGVGTSSAKFDVMKFDGTGNFGLC
jgi:hypothetical protein